MYRQGHDQGDIVPLGAEHTGDVQHRLHRSHVQHGLGRALVPMGKHIIIQAGLLFPDQTSQGNGGVYIRQRVMRCLVADAIGGSQVFQAEAGQAVLTQRPLNTLRAQRIGGAHHVDNIPAGIAVLPFPGIGIVEVAVQRIAGDLVIKAQGIVAHAAGAGPGELLVDQANEFRLR